MNIPLVTNLGPDGTIIEGVHKGREHYYKTALLNTLIALKPRVCLEIGTLHGGTVRVFEKYFDEYRPDGVLVTADIKIYNDLRSPRVRQVRLYPHVAYFNDLHNVEEADLLPDGATKWEQSVELNVAILREELDNIGAEAFDFAFIDGDHRKASAEKDIIIAKALTAPPHYILMEDIREGLHEVSRYYEEVVSKEWEHWDFEDWGMLSGTALIWCE
jgi:hypothetical protein